MKKRFWEYDFFWAVMVLVIFIIGISDPPVWRWIIDEWQDILTVVLFMVCIALIGVILWYDSRLDDRVVHTNNLKELNNWLRNEVDRLRLRVLELEKQNEQARRKN